MDDERRLSFGEDAEQYDRARPSYPAAVVDAVCGGGDVRRVLDVGAVRASRHSSSLIAAVR